MTLRRASLADIDTLVPLYGAFFEEDGIPVRLDAIRRNLKLMLEDDRACIVVAEEDGVVIGISSGSLTFGVEFGCSAELEDLYVVPTKRGRGWAKRLAEAVLDWAADKGADEILLVITPEAEEAQALSRFYEKLGFKDSGRITMYRQA